MSLESRDKEILHHVLVPIILRSCQLKKCCKRQAPHERLLQAGRLVHPGKYMVDWSKSRPLQNYLISLEDQRRYS